MVELLKRVPSIRFNCLILGIFAFALLTLSCKKDEACPLITCNQGAQNQSTCACDCNEGYAGNNCDNFDPSKVQFLLDSNRTPLELVNAGIPIDSLYGKRYQDGLIFHLDTGTGEGMVAATEDQSAEAIWGCDGTLIGGTGDTVGSGKTNTDVILAGCEEDLIAADRCRALGADWFLPSREELKLMWSNLADSDKDSLNTGPMDSNNLGGFTDNFYWSSTENTGKNVWVQHFSSGRGSHNFKFQEYAVRAAKAF